MPERQPFLTFTLGTQQYALSIDEVIEVAAMVELVKVAGMPPQVIGVANRHGMVLPMLDLRPVFRQTASRINTSTLFIVGICDNQYVGLVVDEVHQVVYLDLAEVSPVRLGEAYIRAILPHQGLLIQVITLKPLLAKILPEHLKSAAN